MDGALQCASKELGDEALILNTRQTPKEFLHFGKYEVVCATAQEPEIEKPQPAAPVTSTASEPKANASQRLALFVGPSGAGKSTSCAKAAIQARFEQSLNVAVLSWDASRVGSSDGLRAYCDIAGISFEEITSAASFDDAMKRSATCDLILVDTPSLEGSIPLEREISQLPASYPNAEMHLVLSSTSSAAYLNASYRKYSRFHVTHLLPTHTDEAQMDLNGAANDNLNALTIRWCGTGRAVPEDLQDANQVLRRAAAMAAGASSATAATSPDSNPATPAQAAIAAPARTAIDAILARFRKSDEESRQRSLTPSTTTAA